MIPVAAMREALESIAKEKGEFSLFALVMPSDSPGRWDLVVAAPWLEIGQLKALGEFIRLLEARVGEREVKRLARIATLKGSSPDIRTELERLNVAGQERYLASTTLFGVDVDQAVILRAKPLSPAKPQRSSRDASKGRRRRAHEPE